MKRTMFFSGPFVWFFGFSFFLGKERENESEMWLPPHMKLIFHRFILSLSLSLWKSGRGRCMGFWLGRAINGAPLLAASQLLFSLSNLLNGTKKSFEGAFESPWKWGEGENLFSCLWEREKKVDEWTIWWTFIFPACVYVCYSEALDKKPECCRFLRGWRKAHKVVISFLFCAEPSLLFSVRMCVVKEKRERENRENPLPLQFLQCETTIISDALLYSSSILQPVFNGLLSGPNSFEHVCVRC